MNKLSIFFSSRKSWTLPYIIFSAIFVVIPLLLIVVYAFTDDSGHLTLENFEKFFTHHEAINTFVYSIGIAIITTLICILLGYPAAWILSNAKLNRSKTLVVLFILPMWVNILVRTLATVALFDFFSMPLGEGALIFGMVYNFIPFMIYPIYNTLQKMDHSYIEAAQDLGANPVQVFLKAVLPPVYAGSDEWYYDGVYAYYFYFCHCRATDDEQYKTFRYYHSGEYQQQYVELWCGPVSYYVVADCCYLVVQYG